MIRDFPFRLSELNRTSRNTCLTKWNKPTAPLQRGCIVSRQYQVSLSSEQRSENCWHPRSGLCSEARLRILPYEQNRNLTFYFVTSLRLRQDRVNVLSAGSSFITNVITVMVTEQAHSLVIRSSKFPGIVYTLVHIAQKLKQTILLLNQHTN